MSINVRRETTKLEKLVDLIFMWIVRPIVYAIGFYMIGFLIAFILDGIFRSTVLESLTGWQAWIAYLILGALAADLWNHRHEDNSGADWDSHHR